MLVSTGRRCSLHAWSIEFIIAAGVLNDLELLIPNLKHAVKQASAGDLIGREREADLSPRAKS